MTLRSPLLALVTLAGACALGLGVWLLLNFDPNSPNSIFPPCLFRAATGYYCIGCGATRALHALVHGDVFRAFAMNPLAVLMIPLAPMMAAHANGWKPKPLLPLLRLISHPVFWLILLPAYWIARNLPWWPFTLLAPG